MAEHGATPKVPRWRLRALRSLRSLFTPLLPDDYLEMINPLWSTQELRGRIERVDHETADAATILIKPGWVWEGHELASTCASEWRSMVCTTGAKASEALAKATGVRADGNVIALVRRSARPRADRRRGLRARERGGDRESCHSLRATQAGADRSRWAERLRRWGGGRRRA